MSVAGLNDSNVAYVARAIKEVVKQDPNETVRDTRSTEYSNRVRGFVARYLHHNGQN